MLARSPRQGLLALLGQRGEYHTHDPCQETAALFPGPSARQGMQLPQLCPNRVHLPRVDPCPNRCTVLVGGASSSSSSPPSRAAPRPCAAFAPWPRRCRRSRWAAPAGRSSRLPVPYVAETNEKLTGRYPPLRTSAPVAVPRCSPGAPAAWSWGKISVWQPQTAQYRSDPRDPAARRILNPPSLRRAV